MYNSDWPPSSQSATSDAVSTLGCSMSELRPPSADADAPLPLGQRFFDNWALLLVLGIVIMAVIYTGWGLVEIALMPQAELP